MNIVEGLPHTNCNYNSVDIAKRKCVQNVSLVNYGVHGGYLTIFMKIEVSVQTL